VSGVLYWPESIVRFRVVPAYSHEVQPLYQVQPPSPSAWYCCTCCTMFIITFGYAICPNEGLR
jgi:hypothetical protein